MWQYGYNIMNVLSYIASDTNYILAIILLISMIHLSMRSCVHICCANELLFAIKTMMDPPNQTMGEAKQMRNNYT